METKKCTCCLKEKPFSEFSKKKSGKHGLQSRCKKCHRLYTKRHYKENKDYYIQKAKRNRESIRRWFKEYKSDLGCEKCEEAHISCLEFHHEDPKEKEISVSTAVSRCWSIERIEKEVDKCTVLCSNCHKKLHWKEDE